MINEGILSMGGYLAHYGGLVVISTGCRRQHSTGHLSSLTYQMTFGWHEVGRFDVLFPFFFTWSGQHITPENIVFSNNRHGFTSFPPSLVAFGQNIQAGGTSNLLLHRWTVLGPKGFVLVH